MTVAMDRTIPCPFCRRRPVEEREHRETCPRFVAPMPTMGEVIDMWIDGDEAGLDRLAENDARRRQRAAKGNR
jgi:hypothetical protein